MAFACLPKRQFPECRLRLPTSLFLDSLRVADRSGVRTVLLLCRPEGDSRRLNLVMINATDGEVFHHTATAAMLENLPQDRPSGNAVKIGLVHPHAWR